MASMSLEGLDVKENQACQGDLDQECIADESQSSSAIKPDKYSYTKREEFTSEIFKIEIGNLPKIYSVNHLKKLLLKLKLQPKKVKVIPKVNFAFVTFKCDEDRQVGTPKYTIFLTENFQLELASLEDFTKLCMAKQEINGQSHPVLEFAYAHIQSKCLQMAKPVADPVEVKRQEGDSGETDEMLRFNNLDDTELDIFVRIRNAVTPLWNKSYEEQMTMKFEVVTQIMKKLAKQLVAADAGNWARHQRNENNGMCCPLESLLPSPVLEEYRNKCEFSIGDGAGDNGRVVGFRLGTYKDGRCTVVEPKECTNIPELMKQVLQVFQSYVKDSPLGVFNLSTHEGFWKQLTIRTSCSGDVMCIPQIVTQNMTKDDVGVEIKKLVEHFQKQNPIPLTSMYVDIATASLGNNTDGNTLEHVFGEKYIYETMCGLKFRISPDAFFQVNTKAAEVLYKTVQGWSAVNSNTLVLDICCGTGTIGLSLAKLAKKVVGVEVCPASVEDARFNAISNGINNAEFICGKAEDVIIETTSKLQQDSVVGIVDPPRAGCHGKVIQAIRRCPNLKRLIYISCSPSSVMKDFVDLCRAVSKRTKGDPFRIVKAVPVDLFPQTKHCELIVLLERS